ncbi:hypothetical protein ACFE04_024754 [Oxalis oulophora]
MWSFASKAIAKAVGFKSDSTKLAQISSECSDDEGSANNSKEEGLECPICWESFNMVENVPYVLWCGHTLCKNCVLGLQRAVVRFPTLSMQLPFFITCPWCNLLSLRLVHKGNLKFPRKNFFLMWMVESMNGDRSKSSSHLPECASNGNSPVKNEVSRRRIRSIQLVPQSDSNNLEARQNSRYIYAERLQLSVRKSLVFFLHLTAKFPLIVIFLLFVLYAIPASAAILALYILITIVFAIPSFLVLYFALPSLDWLVREIVT